MRLDRGQIEVIDDISAEILRGKTPAERLKIAFNMWISVHKFLKVYLKKTNPNWNEEMINREVARRLLRESI